MSRRSTSELQSDSDLYQAVRDYLLYYFMIVKGVRREIAEELAQEGLLKAWGQRDLWRGISTLKTFLISVGLNAGRSALVREGRQAKIGRKITQIIDHVWHSRRRTPPAKTN